MAAFHSPSNISNFKTSNNQNMSHNLYSNETGIYISKHPSVTLPTDPFLDVVSRIFSHKHAGQTALVDASSGLSIPYSELQPLLKSVASGLHQMGVAKGDVVLILLPNSIYYPIILLAVLYLGAIVTTMNPLSSFSEVKKQTACLNTRLAFTVIERARN